MFCKNQGVETHLKINSALTNSDFVGYKSTSKDYQFRQVVLKSTVCRSLTPNSTVEYYLKSIAYHNHLLFDRFRKQFYFIDQFSVIWRSNCDFSEFTSVWSIPNNTCQNLGDELFIYYPTIRFLDSYLIVTNGRNSLYVLDTQWNLVHTFDELLNENFQIVDSKQTDDQVNLLVLQINREITTESILTLLTIKKIIDWEIIEKKTLYNSGSVNYASLNWSCSAIYVVSNGKTTLDFDGNLMKLAFGEWKQNESEIEIQLVLNRIFDKKLFNVSIDSSNIRIKCKDVVIFSGDFLYEINATTASWSISLTNKSIEVRFSKKEPHVSWKTLFKEGEKSYEVFEVNDFTATNSTTNAYFTSNVEECDLYDAKELNFERFDLGETKSSHYCEIGRRQFLFNSESTSDAAKSFVLRHNVDAVIWRPSEREGGVDFQIEHIGTLPAYGYIQASKTERKFFDCPDDFSYSIIVEGYRNIYFYSHNLKLWRNSKAKAEQKIFNLPNAGDEIVGCFCTPTNFFILTNNSFFIFNLKD